MGSGGSKPEQQLFSNEGPVRFSQAVLDSLQQSPETDSTRAKDAELKVHQRISDDLYKTRDSQQKQLIDLVDSITINPGKTPEITASPFVHDPTSLAYHFSSPFYHDFTQKPDAGEKRVDSGRSYKSVSMEISKLKEKLESRKKVEKVSPEVEKAQEALVQCLRTNDRRPLDCWQEVEAFKAEVSKLEKAFIQRAGR